MGVNYAYQLIFPMQSIDSTLRTIAARLINSDREQLLAALPWRPKTSVQFKMDDGVIQEAFDMENFPNYFSMPFALDDELESYLEYRGKDRPPLEDGRVPLSIDFHIFAGEKLGLITFAAPISRISRVFDHSDGVRQSFIEIAASTEAFGVFFDVELAEDWHLLYPQDRWIHCPELAPVYWHSDGQTPQFFEKALVKILAEIASPFWIGAGYRRLLYNTREGVITFRSEGGNMVEPPIRAFFPTPDAWDQHAPAWARDRRSEIFEHISQWLATKNRGIVMIDDNAFIGNI